MELRGGTLAPLNFILIPTVRSEVSFLKRRIDSLSLSSTQALQDDVVHRCIDSYIIVSDEYVLERVEK